MTFKHAARALAKTLAAHSGQSVVYRRGEMSFAIIARKGRMSAEEAERLGISLSTEDVDWIIQRSEWRNNPLGTTDPQRGDEIDETDEDTGKVFTYEAMPAGSEPCWRYSDTARQMIRIHTKQTNHA